jgi:hypothetical protein
MERAKRLEDIESASLHFIAEIIEKAALAIATPDSHKTSARRETAPNAF